MEFDFLTKLPSPNLDDRTFDDLVDECTLRIPRYCPEWTDHNLSDPGITMIELFAWLTDQMLLRFNQVPRKNYIAFLELLGIRLQSPRPAQTDLTFYLAADLPEIYTLPASIEVTTGQNDQESVVFTTDEPIQIGVPRLRHFLVGRMASDEPPQQMNEPMISGWTVQDNAWSGPEQNLFDEQPQPGNCFYLVLAPETPLEANVLAVSFRGQAGTPTGIDPTQPPRKWDVWDGKGWQSVLLQEKDDATRGFSFYELEQQGNNPTQGAEVILHVPKSFPVVNFIGYSGRWIRCVATAPQGRQAGYSSSPRIIGIGVRSIGGTVAASQCDVILNERLGVSDGNPGQKFLLQAVPVLERQAQEYILVEPPNGVAQRWGEVKDFSESTANSKHYVIDSLTGTVQFGPLIREPNSLRSRTQARAQIQEQGRYERAAATAPVESPEGLEHQYGAIPPAGSTIQMVRYRTGGGRQGNVQAETLRFLRSAVPYVERVTNHVPAFNGADAESLEQVVLRAPQFLRTRDRAVTAEDFETLTRQAGAVSRVRCLTPTDSGSPGLVKLLVVPQANPDTIQQERGIAPAQLSLNPPLRHQITDYLDKRRLLGIQMELAEPQYVGVSVQVQVALQDTYDNPQAQRMIASQLRVALYRFLNPLMGGGFDGNGWPFGRTLYPSDIIALLQQTPGILYIGPVVLFALRRQENRWERQVAPEFIDPGPLGLVCSWADAELRSGHVVDIIRRPGGA